MITSLLRCTLVGVVLLALANSALGDWSPTETAFPGWQVTTSEDVWANRARTSGLKRYPISNLFDGALSTAWVFEGKKWDWRKGLVILGPKERYASEGGVGHWIEIRSLAEEPSPIDAVGIVNGYAKSPTIFARNNRITRICIETGSLWKPSVIKTVSLQEVTRMQTVPIPETKSGAIRVRVQAVARGPDNDLCISELQLYHRGRPLIPNPPPHVLYSAGDECGCGYTMSLVDSRGRVLKQARQRKAFFWPLYRFSPDASKVAISYGADEKSIAVIDLYTGDQIYNRKAAASPCDFAELEWTNRKRVRYSALVGDEKVRFEIDLATAHPAAKIVGRQKVERRVEPVLQEAIDGLRLPKEAVATLEAECAGWHIMGTSGFDDAVVRTVQSRVGVAAGPQYCWGDFDGNELQDIALLIRRTAKVKLVALRQTAVKRWALDDLLTFSFGGGFQGGYSKFTIYLTPRAPGMVAYWPKDGAGKTGRMELLHDAIELNYEGKASTLYYWTPKGYRTVQTGD